MGIPLNFNASTVPPAEPGFPVWEGLVPVVIKRTEVQETAAKNGNKFLSITVMALDGHYKGQENAIRLNLWNSNAQASDIASRQLSAICHVTGRMQIADSDQLIGAQFLSVWAREERETTDQATGQTRKTESCQCKDYRYLDGRTIREANNGQPAAMPYAPGGAAPAHSPPPAQPPMPPTPPMPPQAQPGFPAPASAPPVQPAAGFAPAGAPVMAPAGFQPAPAAQAMPTAASGFSPGPAPGGFAPPQPGQAAPPGFAPPAPGQPPVWGR